MKQKVEGIILRKILRVISVQYVRTKNIEKVFKIRVRWRLR